LEDACRLEGDRLALAAAGPNEWILFLEQLVSPMSYLPPAERILVGLATFGCSYLSGTSRSILSCAAGALAVLLLVVNVAIATNVRFETSVGNIDVSLHNTVTPLSVANFLNYANSNRYNNTFVHRVPQSLQGGSADFVVQGGGFLLNNSIYQATGITTDAPIGNEPFYSNQRGTLAFAKNSLGATSQWFFNLGDNSFLDNQAFTVFGRVVGSSMSVVDAINDLQTVNFAKAQNVPGEDFDEIPVKDRQKVLNQDDITNSDAVIVNRVIVYPLGDFTFNGVVNLNDYTVWKNNFGSTSNLAADGNGDGTVNAADFTLWRNAFAASGAGGLEELSGLGAVGLPEPSALVTATLAGAWICGMRHRRRRP